MLISIILISLIAFGGLALTYLVTDDETFMWRLAAGNIIGSAVFGLIGFVLALLFGFGAVTAGTALAITLLPVLLFRIKSVRGTFRHDWAKAKGKLQGGNLKRFSGFGYYAFFALVFWLFFSQTMYETSQGIFTGGSNNLGDLPFHLGAIFGFTEGNNFPPQNPSFAGAKFSYPFIADFLTASFIKLGADVKDAMILQNISWAFSLLVLLERFTAKLTGSKLAGRIAPLLLFFSGGLGFVWFLKDYWEQSTGLWSFLWHLPRDYTIGDHFRWGNSMVVLFITQRSLLLGMPLTVMVLGYLWRVFSQNDAEPDHDPATHKHHDAGKHKKASETAAPLLRSKVIASGLVGLLAGTLPLIHMHSLAVLFVVTAFLFFFKLDKWREWIAFGVGVSVMALPELVWTMAGSASEISKFIGWHFGWDKRDDNVLWFWLKNTGIVIPVLAAGIYLLLRPEASGGDHKAVGQRSPINGILLFYIPFALLFVVSNIAKLAPWEWDNIKVLFYWFVGSLPIIAYAIAWAWQESKVMRTAAIGCLVVMTFAGGLDVWRTASGQNKIKVFDTDAIRIAEQIKGKTPANALFLNAPTYNSAVVLSGRRSFIRYTGHLSSHGIDYAEREEQTKRMYEGGGLADTLLRTNEIEYVLVSPEERNALTANEGFFGRFPVIAEAGQYRVYKIK